MTWILLCALCLMCYPVLEANNTTEVQANRSVEVKNHGIKAVKKESIVFSSTKVENTSNTPATTKSTTGKQQKSLNSYQGPDSNATVKPDLSVYRSGRVDQPTKHIEKKRADRRGKASDSSTSNSSETVDMTTDDSQSRDQATSSIKTTAGKRFQGNEKEHLGSSENPIEGKVLQNSENKNDFKYEKFLNHSIRINIEANLDNIAAQFGVKSDQVRDNINIGAVEINEDQFISLKHNQELPNNERDQELPNNERDQELPNNERDQELLSFLQFRSCLPCPVGFEYVASVNKCYKVNTRRLSWQQAREDCLRQGPGSTLAVMLNKQENDAVLNLLKRSKYEERWACREADKRNIVSAYFISGQRQAYNGPTCEAEFVWRPNPDSGYIPMHYRNFRTPHPHCGPSGHEHCITLSYISSDTFVVTESNGWFEESCFKEFCSICQLEPPKCNDILIREFGRVAQ